MPQRLYSISALGGSDISPTLGTINKDVANFPQVDVLESQTEINHTARAEEDDDGNVDVISRRLYELQCELLTSLKDDVSDWINKTLGDTDLNADNLIHALDTGVILCRLSVAIEKKARECVQNGMLKEPLPDYKLHCNVKAKSGTWFARDNTTNFLKWCRAYGMTDETMFDSEDLVTHHQEKQVIYCLMELARMGCRFGLEPSSLITMEKEIDSRMTLPSATTPDSPTPPVYMGTEASPTAESADQITQDVPHKSTASSSTEQPAKVLPTLVEEFDLDSEVYRISIKCQCEGFVNKISEGVFNVFGKRVFIRLLKGRRLMVRVGGGWDTFEHYLLHHDPVQVFRFTHGASNRSIQSLTQSESHINQQDFLVIRSKYKSSSFCSAEMRVINL